MSIEAVAGCRLQRRSSAQAKEYKSIIIWRISIDIDKCPTPTTPYVASGVSLTSNNALHALFNVIVIVIARTIEYVIAHRPSLSMSNRTSSIRPYPPSVLHLAGTASTGAVVL